MYSTVRRARVLYSLLQDELSQKIFKARLEFDLEPFMTNAVKLLSFNLFLPKNVVNEVQRWREKLDTITKAEKKFALYGTGGRCGPCSFVQWG